MIDNLLISAYRYTILEKIDISILIGKSLSREKPHLKKNLVPAAMAEARGTPGRV
jgi:hypothetical protein